MKNGFLFFLALTSCSVFSQTYTVGTQTITYTDAARSNRAVEVEFRYPGTNGALASGQFPFVIFAHGFQMDQVPYYPYADSLAKQGYIVGLLTTETSLSPSHANFAQDLIFVHDKLISESNTNMASLFYQNVVPKGALGGHSMGGGSTVLSAQYGNPATCYFTFAAAVTNPSSTTAAPSMTKPYLSFAGSRDCIAPIATHQQLMYDASGSSCKFLINITDALHCQFGNGNFQCNLGEGFSFCASSPLSRADQINKTLLFLVPYLDYYLKGDCSAWTLFESRYASNTGDAMQRNCTNVIPSNPSISGNNYFCNGSNTTLTAQPASFSYVWNDNSTANALSVAAAGNYSVVVGNGVCALPSVSVSVTESFPPANPTGISGSDTVCSNIANIGFSVANDTTATTYNWTLPNGWTVTSGSNTNAIETTSDMSGGIISVTAENNCGLSSAVQKNVVVVPSNLGSAGLITGDTLFCEGETAQYFIATVSGADSYIWTYPTSWTLVGGSNNDTVLVLVSGSGPVNVQAANDCGQSIPAVLDVTVSDTPQVTISVQGSQLVSQTTGSSYQWYLNGVALNGERSSSISPSQSGNYSVVVTNASGCSGISQAVNFILTDVMEITDEAFRIYPNPNATGVLNFETSRQWEGAAVEAFDMEGRIMRTREIIKPVSAIDISGFPKGIYTITIEKNGQKLRKKLVIQ
ncbi:MAG: T9SS type A sorting domain-containing protein [Bacteroidota bacterium]